jgi:hypothetical protein
MKNYTKTAFLSAALATLLLPATAQSGSTGQPAVNPNTPGTATGTPAKTNGPENQTEINERKTRQQERISKGLGDGQLSTAEADALEKREGQINKEEREMKAADGGHLTAADRAKLQQQQNQESRQIYKDKHNSYQRNTDPKTGIGRTEQAQQERIAQGEKSGQITAGESTHLENEERNINRERHKDITANGGTLTPAERAQIKQQQKQVNKQIYKDKHNHAHR